MTSQADLADELIDHHSRVQRDWNVATSEECAEALAWLDPRLVALSAEREDELGHPHLDRDEEWLAVSKHAVKIGRGVRHAIVQRLASISRAEQRALDLKTHHDNEIVSFTALKETLKHELGRAGYVALWERVHNRHPLTRLRKLDRQDAEPA